MNFDFDKTARMYASRQSTDIPDGFFDRQLDEILSAADSRQRCRRNRFITSAASAIVAVAAAIGVIAGTGQSGQLSTDEMIDRLIAESTDAQISMTAGIADAEMMFDLDYYN